MITTQGGGLTQGAALWASVTTRDNYVNLENLMWLPKKCYNRALVQSFCRCFGGIVNKNVNRLLLFRTICIIFAWKTSIIHVNLMGKFVRTLTITYDLDIEHCEVPLFRGAVIQSLENKSLLFHNHQGDKLRYAYPLIQYKTIQHRAAIFCLGEGTEEIGELFTSQNNCLVLGEGVKEVQVDRIMPRVCNVQEWNQMFKYRINRWIPFNSANYAKFNSVEGVVEQTRILEKLLIGNILSFAKGLGIHFEQEVQCKITSVSPVRIVKIKGVKKQSYQVEFNCNVSLPDYIGLGKHASINCGVVTRRRDREEITV